MLNRELRGLANTIASIHTMDPSSSGAITDIADLIENLERGSKRDAIIIYLVSNGFGISDTHFSERPPHLNWNSVEWSSASKKLEIESKLWQNAGETIRAEKCRRDAKRWAEIATALESLQRSSPPKR